MSLHIRSQKRQTDRNLNGFKKPLFLIAVFLFLIVGIKAKNAEDSKIYRLCEQMEGEIEKPEKIASDNASLFLFYNNKINSFDIRTFEKNWEFLYSGKLLNQKIILDKENLSFITESNNEEQNTLFAETVLSLKSGIPVYIRQIDSRTETVKLISLKNKNNPLDLMIDLQKIKSENLNSLSISQWAQENDGIYVGLKNGDLIHFSENKNLLNWKTKTGGEITNLLIIPQGVLVTSNDNFTYLFERKKADKIWKKRLSGRVKGLYLLDDSKLVLEVNDSEYLLQLDVRDGSESGKIIKDYKGKIHNIFQTTQNQLLLISDSGLYKYSTSDCKR